MMMARLDLPGEGRNLFARFKHQLSRACGFSVFPVIVRLIVEDLQLNLQQIAVFIQNTHHHFFIRSVPAHRRNKEPAHASGCRLFERYGAFTRPPGANVAKIDFRRHDSQPGLSRQFPCRYRRGKLDKIRPYAACVSRPDAHDRRNQCNR